MAVIGRIRKRVGLVIAIVGVALVAFILSDFLKKPNQQNVTDLAKVNRKKITNIEYQNRLNLYDGLYPEGQKPQGEDLFDIHNQVYSELLRNELVSGYLTSLGLSVKAESGEFTISEEELLDLYVGDHISPIITQFFGDPQTGQVNTEQVRNVIQNFDQLSPEDQRTISIMEKLLKEERLYSKYLTLISNAYYMPSVIAQKQFDDNNISRSYSYIYKPYQDISDEDIVLTDADYEEYYEAHKYENVADESLRNLSFIVYEARPSEQDRVNFIETFNELYTDFAQVPTDKSELATFVKRNQSIVDFDSIQYLKSGMLAPQIDSIFFGIENVKDTNAANLMYKYSEGNMFSMARLVDRQERPDSMNCSHIFIGFNPDPNQPQEGVNRDYDQAKAFADSLFTELEANPSSFEELGLQFGDNALINASLQLAANTLSMGWFTDGGQENALVPLYNTFCATNNIGDIEIIPSQLGFHIVKIDDQKSFNTKVNIATITKELTPSSITYDSVNTMASNLHFDINNEEDFDRVIVENELSRRESPYLRITNYDIAGIPDSREIVRWAFNPDREDGEISTEIYQIDDFYIIVLLKEIIEAGPVSLDILKENPEFVTLVKRDVKAKTLIQTVSSAAVSNDMEAIASKLETEVIEIPSHVFGSPNIQGVGPEPVVVGRLFAMTSGAISAPIKGDQGIFIIKYNDETTLAETPENYEQQKQQLMMNYVGIFSREGGNLVFKAHERRAKITDNRVFFF